VGVSQTLRRCTEGATYIFGRDAITLGVGPHSSFCVYFVLWYISFDWWMCVFVVLSLFSPEIGLAERLRNDIVLCRVGRKTVLTHSLATLEKLHVVIVVVTWN